MLMLYDFSWLREGEIFPPDCELGRLKNYKDNALLFEGKTDEVLKPYKQRFDEILSKFDNADVSFKLDINYHKLITLKTGDLVCGEPPSISSDDIVKHTDFNNKLLTSVYDVSRFADSVLRVYYNQSLGKNDFVVMSPSMWFPIVSRENHSEVLTHTLAWIVDETPFEKNSRKKKYILNVQTHERGRFKNRKFQIAEFQNQTVYLSDGLNVELPRYKIGSEIKIEDRWQITGLDDFAIVTLHNTRTANSVYGISDYDAITPLVAELELRYSLESLVLDKHTAPTMHAPESSFIQNKMGEMVFKTGSVVMVGSGQELPGYLIWDASLQANHEQIKNLERMIFEISEMGAMINNESFASSQGYEALRIRLMPALTKARRLTNSITRPICKLIDLLSQKGYERVKAQDVSIYWNDGLPNDEMRDVDIALKKLQILPHKTVLKEQFGYSDEDAEDIAEEKKSENIASLAGGFALGVGGDE